MINKLLIANRGEIACRIIKTAKKMSIKTVAVYSDIDRQASHVMMADEAYPIGPAPSIQSYLNSDKIISVAKKARVQAIHPGYGFLAENPTFAHQCQQADIIFVGPNPDALSQMGDKALAKRLLSKANVPCVPGYQGDQQEPEFLREQALLIGFPLLIKATAGGGGKGMRHIGSPEEFIDGLHQAKKEALTSFDNETVILEKYLNPTRHIEVQIFSDNHGRTVHLFDRDCSLQRRHQKVVEEAPAPDLSLALRARMAEAAIAVANTIHYSGAGTVEFLVTQDEKFYFMEMNTRLQVEHPVTEFVTGIDLVEWQLRVASNEHLPLRQDQITCQGHAIEARVCAEKPESNFLPATGQVDRLLFPCENASLRVDTGIGEKDKISPYYDSLLAKVITHAKTREEAINKLQQALCHTSIIGVNNNVNFISRLLKTNDFLERKLHTEFIEKNHQNLFIQRNQLPKEILIIATLADLRHRQQQSQAHSCSSPEPDSPWLECEGWQTNALAQHQCYFWYREKRYFVTAVKDQSKFSITHDKKMHSAAITWQDEVHCTATIDTVIVNARVIQQPRALHIFVEGEHYCVSLCSPLPKKNKAGQSVSHYCAPMPSTVVEFFVKPQQYVKTGEKLATIEAMKMQHTLTALAEGTVKKINFKPGDMLHEGDTLLVIDKFR